VSQIGIFWSANYAGTMVKGGIFLVLVGGWLVVARCTRELFLMLTLGAPRSSLCRGQRESLIRIKKYWLNI
jgi:hypothetical protein